jgi:hypothetical protein
MFEANFHVWWNVWNFKLRVLKIIRKKMVSMNIFFYLFSPKISIIEFHEGRKLFHSQPLCAPIKGLTNLNRMLDAKKRDFRMRSLNLPFFVSVWNAKERKKKYPIHNSLSFIHNRTIVSCNYGTVKCKRRWTKKKTQNELLACPLSIAATGMRCEKSLLCQSWK